MKKEYLILGIKNHEIVEKLKELGANYAEIKSSVHDTLSYYMVDIPHEKSKILYENGAELIGKISELPAVFYSLKGRPTDVFLKFKQYFGNPLDQILIREELPATAAILHQTLLCSSGGGPSIEDISKRDSFISSVYMALAKLSMSTA